MPRKEKKALNKKQLERLAKKEAKQDAKKLVEGEKEAFVTRAAVLDQAVITGNLISRPDALDVKIDQFSVTTYGKQLVADTVLELNYGRRYGLIGQNGSGKTTILAAIAAREAPIPDSIDMWFLDHEAPPSDNTAVHCVIEKAKTEYERLEALTLQLLEEDPEKNADMLENIGERLDKTNKPTVPCGVGTNCPLWGR